MLFVQPAVKINSATLATVTTTLKKVYCKTFVVFQTTISFSSRRGASALLTSRDRLCGDYNYDLTSIRRLFDCLSKVIKVTVTSVVKYLNT